MKFISPEFKRLFTLTKSEQRGVAVLLLLIFAVIGINLLLPFFVHPPEGDEKSFRKEVARFFEARRKLEDSLTIVNLQNSGELDEAMAKARLKPFPFNPNKLAEEQWLKMGLTKKQVAAIKRYEARGGKFRKKEDLKKLYVISDVEYRLLEPWIHIPDEFVTKGEPPAKHRSFSVKAGRKQVALRAVDINHADSAVLVKNLGLSPWLAARIVRYRNLLGGYFRKSQLREVYGMNSGVYGKIKSYVRIDTSDIRKIDINNASFREILRHPYFDFKSVKIIVSGRKERYGYKSLTEIEKDLNLPDSVAELLGHYLFIRPVMEH